MIKNKILGLLLALSPIPGLCFGNDLALQPELIEATAPTYLPLLQLAEADSTNSGIAAMPVTAARKRERPPSEEFPHLNIPDEPDWDGLRHDSKLFLSYQVAVVGALYLMPESVSKWGDEQKGGSISGKWKSNVTNLRKDDDNWEINYIGHPYFGATYYVRARQRGYDRKSSFWYAGIMSTLYEYGIEAIFEPSSIQDMIITPVGGAIVGEYFLSARENIRRRISETGVTSTSDKVKLFLTDPLDAINKKVDKWFGLTDSQEARLEVLPMFELKPKQHYTPALVGLQALYSW